MGHDRQARLERASVKSVLVIASPRKPVGQDVALSVAAWCRKAGLKVYEDFASQLDLTTIDADLAISVGGDGTILTTARRMRTKPIPTIGLNVGKLGFLAEFSEADIRDWLAGRREIDMRLTHRMLLKCTVSGNGETITRYALNDATVQQGVMTRLLLIDMWVDDSHAIQYRSDGVIVATPGGSTAYSLSLGGPILTPELDAFIVAPIAPHTLTNRAIVVGRQSLKFAFLTSSAEMALVLDGHKKLPLTADSEIRIERAEKSFPLVSHGNRSFFYLLRNKLGWGESPAYQQEEE